MSASIGRDCNGDPLTAWHPKALLELLVLIGQQGDMDNWSDAEVRFALHDSKTGWTDE